MTTLKTKAEHETEATTKAREDARQFLVACHVNEVFSADTIASMETTLVTMLMLSYNRGAMAGIDMLDAALPRFK